jgi:hypothetical protein
MNLKLRILAALFTPKVYFFHSLSILTYTIENHPFPPKLLYVSLIVSDIARNIALAVKVPVFWDVT